MQQAVVEVNGCLSGELALEWQHVCDLVEQQHLGLPEALGRLKQRNGLPELDVLVDQLIAGHVRGQALGEPLAAFSMGLRSALPRTSLPLAVARPSQWHYPCGSSSLYRW